MKIRLQRFLWIFNNTNHFCDKQNNKKEKKGGMMDGLMDKIE